MPGVTTLATDDWPYIYLERPSVPVLYFLLAGVLVLLFARGVWWLGAAATVKNWSVSNAHFFFLGAAFMLLEVQNISKASVVLGNTWSVNAVVISGVMTMILLANLIAAKLPALPQIPVYSLLIGSCIGLYFVDLSRFAFLPYTTKAVVVGLLTSLPMLFSGVVFVRSFAATDRKDSALAANLMGALAGGLLQSITFVTGIKGALADRDGVLPGGSAVAAKADRSGCAAGTGAGVILVAQTIILLSVPLVLSVVSFEKIAPRYAKKARNLFLLRGASCDLCGFVVIRRGDPWSVIEPLPHGIRSRLRQPIDYGARGVA